MQEVRRANTKKTDEKDPAENANTEVVPLVEKNLKKHMEKEKLEIDGKNGIPSSQGTTLVMTGGTPKKNQKMTAAKSKASPKAKTKGSLGNKTKNEKSEKMHDKKKTKIDAKKDAKVKGKKKVLDKAMTVDDVKKKLHAVLRLVGFLPLVIWFVSVSTKFDPNLGLHIDIWPSITTLQNQCNLIRQTNLHVRIDIIRCTVWKRFILRLTVLDGELANVTSLMIRRNGLPVGVLNVRSAWSVYVLRGSKLPYNMNSKNELEIAWMSRSSRTGLEKKTIAFCTRIACVWHVISLHVTLYFVSWTLQTFQHVARQQLCLQDCEAHHMANKKRLRARVWVALLLDIQNLFGEHPEPKGRVF